MRIKVIDRDGRLLADSGSYGELFEARPFRLDNAAMPDNPSLTALQLFLDEAGNYRGFKMPAGAADGYVLTSDANGVGTWQEAAGGGGEDSDWTFHITDTADTTLMTGGPWGIGRYGNTQH